MSKASHNTSFRKKTYGREEKSIAQIAIIIPSRIPLIVGQHRYRMQLHGEMSYAEKKNYTVTLTTRAVKILAKEDFTLRPKIHSFQLVGLS